MKSWYSQTIVAPIFLRPKFRVKNILINGTDSKASFNVKDNGVMQVDGIIKVGNRSHVDINLLEKEAPSGLMWRQIRSGSTSRNHGAGQYLVSYFRFECQYTDDVQDQCFWRWGAR